MIFFLKHVDDHFVNCEMITNVEIWKGREIYDNISDISYCRTYCKSIVVHANDGIGES